MGNSGEIVWRHREGEVRLLTHKRTYELLQMEDNKSINDLFTKVMKLVNQMKVCGKVCNNKIQCLQFISKILMITKDEINWYPNKIYLSVHDSNKKEVR